MSNRFGKLLFVDLETTGPNPALDLITEIGIVEVSEAGVARWSSLVNPGVPIPPFIQQLTGISDDMVADAPFFPELIEEVQQRLNGGLFIAHNARFDYGFLRQAFKRAGISLRCDVLCTVKLSRKLFPSELKHSLDALVARHGLLASARHRALADADLLWQFWRKLEATMPRETIDEAVAHQLHRPGLPTHLEPEILDDLPEAPGIYVFRDDNDKPLYVGRAAQLRSRVLAHFHGDKFSHKDMLLARCARRLEWRETAGDIGARLQEAQLLRVLRPEHNQLANVARVAYAWKRNSGSPGMAVPEFTLVSSDKTDFAGHDELYGPFNSVGKAEMALHALTGARDGAADTGPDSGGNEAGMASLRIQAWPYDGPMALVEAGPGGREDLHVVNRWRYLGTAEHDHEAWSFVEQSTGDECFDADIYKTLTRGLALGKLVARPLAPRKAGTAIRLALH
jgi:DNA polymerase III subunit epsilon